MKNKILAFMILGIFILSLASVSAGLGSFKQNSCVDIRVLANCSAVNLTEVRGVVVNQPMSLLGGQTFNYTYCNTSELGIYAYSWNNPCVDCSEGDCGNSFEVTPTGEDTSGLSSLGIILACAIIAGLLFYSSTFFAAEQKGLKTLLISFGLLFLILTTQIAKVSISGKTWLEGLAQTGLTLMIVLFSIFIMYFMIMYTKDAVIKVRESRRQKLQARYGGYV